MSSVLFSPPTERLNGVGALSHGRHVEQSDKGRPDRRPFREPAIARALAVDSLNNKRVLLVFYSCFDLLRSFIDNKKLQQITVVLTVETVSTVFCISARHFLTLKVELSNFALI